MSKPWPEIEPNPKMKNTTIHIPVLFIQFLDHLVDLGLIPSRSEGIRMAIADFIPRWELIMAKVGPESGFWVDGKHYQLGRVGS